MNTEQLNEYLGNGWVVVAEDRDCVAGDKLLVLDGTPAITQFGGILVVYGGTTTITQSGGRLYVYDDTTTITQSGGYLSIHGGTPSITQSGGRLYIRGGTPTITQSGGDLSIRGGTPTITQSNGQPIRLLTIDQYKGHATRDRLQIGCQNLTWEEWLSKHDSDLESISSGTATLAAAHREELLKIMEELQK
jgi:hypothetical protein